MSFLGGGTSGFQAKKDISTEGGGDRTNERTTLVRSGFSTNSSTLACSPLKDFLRNCKKYNTASASDRTKFLKLKAINSNYNDIKFGGDDSNGSFMALNHVRH
jgi:hypothetical protein